MPPEGPPIELSYIRVDTKCKIFQASYPGFVQLGFDDKVHDMVLQVRDDISAPALEIQPLIVNGPTSNRIDLIFFGDGCAYIYIMA